MIAAQPLQDSIARPRQGHPRGLYTLFFTEMWERFSYYGMRALLVLFMTAAIADGGLGLTDKTAASIYGLYTAAVYLAALPGGWVADRFLGARRSVWLGGIIIALGQSLLIFPRPETFYLGLVGVVLGTGLLKPNISAMVAELYPEGGARRDAGFTIFYMGINLGAAIAPLVAGAVGEKINWRYGFGVAALGMVLGLVQFRLTSRHLGQAGLHPGAREGPKGRDKAILLTLLGSILALIILAWTGIWPVNPVRLARWTAYLILAVAVLYFAGAFLFFGLDREEKRRVAMILLLFIASAMFWSGFEQAGSSLNLFAERYTERVLTWLNHYEVPASTFQSLGPIFVISLAPVMAAFWVTLARRGAEPSLPVKFAAGLLLLGLGFAVMAWASNYVASGVKVLPTWLITTYFLHTLGELCVSPVGLSSVTGLSPKRMVGQMMGIWFLATALGNLIAGVLAGEFNADAVDRMAGGYLRIVLSAVATAVFVVLAGMALRSKGSNSGPGKTLGA